MKIFNCKICNKEFIRYPQQIKNGAIHHCSHKCSGLSKRKRSISTGGYITLRMPEHPNAMRNGRIYEHQLIMSNKLKRPLQKQETIHHKNGIRDDNRIENLELWCIPRQRNGQRVSDLLNFCVKHYRNDIIKLLNTTT